MIARGPVSQGAGPRFIPGPKTLIAAGIVVAFLGAVVALVLSLQSRLAFPYIPPSAQIPGAVRAVGGEVIWLDVDGRRVEAWFLPVKGAAAAPLIMNTHGNGELIDQWAERVAPLRNAGFGVLLVEYPGMAARRASLRRRASPPPCSRLTTGRRRSRASTRVASSLTEDPWAAAPRASSRNGGHWRH